MHANSTVSRLRAAIAICCLAAVVYNVPRFFERSTTTLPSPTSNSSGDATLVSRTALRENTIYIIVYKTALFFVARFLLPFSALAFFNTHLIRTNDTPCPRIVFYESNSSTLA